MGVGFRTRLSLSVSGASKIKVLRAIFFKVLLYVRELLAMMFGCKCFFWNKVTDFSSPPEPKPFSLPAPIPIWPEELQHIVGKISPEAQSAIAEHFAYHKQSIKGVHCLPEAPGAFTGIASTLIFPLITK